MVRYCDDDDDDDDRNVDRLQRLNMGIAFV